MWSQYLLTREMCGVVAVFHELHPDPIYCSSEQWKRLSNEITDNAEVLIGDLKQRKLIIESLDDDRREFKKVATDLEHKLDQPTILYLMTAQGCNFGCGYCPVPETAKKNGASLLSVEDAIAGIELWQEHLKDVYDSSLQYLVIFYGGEPLLNKETIKVSLACLKMKKDTGALPPNINFETVL
ncbi:MAG: radical SAM protein [Patescibacteria group bacterium]